MGQWTLTIDGDDDPIVLDDAMVAMLLRTGTVPLDRDTTNGPIFATLEGPDGTSEKDLNAVAAGIIHAIEQSVTQHTEGPHRG